MVLLQGDNLVLAQPDSEPTLSARGCASPMVHVVLLSAVTTASTYFHTVQVGMCGCCLLPRSSQLGDTRWFRRVVTGILLDLVSKVGCQTFEVDSDRQSV